MSLTPSSNVLIDSSNGRSPFSRSETICSNFFKEVSKSFCYFLVYSFIKEFDFTDLVCTKKCFIFSGSINQQGVNINVKKAEKVRPQTTANDIGLHHSATLPPISTSRANKSTPKPEAKGSRPITVVAVVRIIGRSL